MHTEFWWENLRERDLLEDPGIDGRIMLIWIYRKWGHGLDCFASGQGEVAGTCKCHNEPLGSIKCNFLTS